MCDVTHRDEGISNSEHADLPREVWNKENLPLCLAKIHNLYLLPTQRVFMCFVWISEQTAIISLYNID